MNKATCYNSSTPLMALRNPEGFLVTSDREKADILNEHFSTIGEKLAGELPILNEDLTTYFTRVTPTIMHITLTPDVIKKALLKLNPGKASGPYGVAPRLFKLTEKHVKRVNQYRSCDVEIC